jgi:hypothetical protein
MIHDEYAIRSKSPTGTALIEAGEGNSLAATLVLP